jgi:hypothetical protein
MQLVHGLAQCASCVSLHPRRTCTNQPGRSVRMPELGLLMASQWPNIHFSTWVDMPQQLSQSLVRDADYSSTWLTGQQSALNGIPGA